MKRLGIVLFVSCFLLLSNATIAIGAIPVSKISIKNQSTTTTIENGDKPLVEEKIVITDENDVSEIVEDDKITNPEQNTAPTLETVSKKIIIQPEEKVTPGQQQAFLYPANAQGPYFGSIGQPIQFLGSSQYLFFDGVTYSWDFDGDGTYDWSSTYSGVTTYIYQKPGKYLATFKVTKNNGKTYIDMAPVYVDIDGDHLQPYGGCCYYGTVGEPILFDASQSTSTGSPIKSYKWYFGDGTIGYGKKVYHTYNESIPYLVHLEITDRAGNKRIDVLHADIGCKLSKYDDFLATSNQVIQDILSYIKDFIQNRLFFYLLNVKIVTNHNGYETITDVPNGYALPQIDVDNDGDYDIQIIDISFFNFENPTPSDFTGLSTYSWKSSFSAKVIPRPPGYEGIKQSDNFTILLQFTLGSIITSILGIEEPVIQIGYTSKAGEEKTSEFTISHRFRPYLLERFLGGNSQNNQNEEYNGYNQNINEPIIYYGTNTQTSSSQQTQTYNNYEPASTPIGTTEITENPSEQSTQAQPITIKHKTNRNLVDPNDLYPEQEVKVENIDVEKFSLVIACANSNNPSYPRYTRTELQLSFDQFVDSTIKSKRFHNVGFNGYSQSGDASLTLTISRQKNGRKATLGLIIDPIQNFITDVDYTKNAEGVCTLTFNIDKPPENLVLFAESEDSWGEYKSNYFYLENIPSTLSLNILPKLEDGYISVIRETNGEFKVGIKNDLKEPSINLYVIHPSLKQTRIDWKLLSQPHSIKLKSNTNGLSLNAEIKDLTQQDQNIEFHGTLQNDLEVEIEWSFIDGYLALRKSVTTIDFDFSYTQNDLNLMVEGIYTGGTGSGLIIDFDGFGKKGVIEIDTGREIFVHVSGKKSTATLSTDIDFSTNGHMKLEWDQATIFNADTSHALTFRNLDFNAPDFTITAQNISFAGSSSFKLDLTSIQLQIGGSNQITLSNVEVVTKHWSGAIGYAKSIGSFNINLQPSIKYYSLAMNQLLKLENFRLIFDSYNNEYDTDFGIENLNLINNGAVWFDFNSLPLKFEMSTQYQTSTLNLENLHLAIGPQNIRNIDFTIPSFNVNSGGIIHSEFNSQHFYVAANIAFNWNLDVTTLSYGNWKIEGAYSGSGTMDVTEWQPGIRGQVAIGVIQPIQHSLKIIHGQLELELGNLTLNQGSSTIKWKREQSTSNGYFNITSSVSGSLTLCKLIYNDSQNPVEFSIDNIQIHPVKLNVSWQKLSDIKWLHINKNQTNQTTNLGLIKIKWADKTLTIGNIGLKSGQFHIVYDSANKIITLNNGMNAFGPLCTYEDADRKLSVDLLNLVNDYSKTMTLKWYEDSNNKIIGLYLDTDNTQLVDWITFTSIRFGSTPTGRRIALGGFKADDFKIMKNVNDKIEITGKLYIANHITYSRLVNLQTDQWEDLDIEWDLQSDLKLIRFESEFDLTIKLLSFEIGDVKFTSELDLTDYMEVKWKLAGGPTVQKEFYFDTNGQTISSLSFRLLGPDNRGIEIIGGGVYAENFYVKWKLWPPSQADIQWGGTIGYDTATVYGTQDGNTWIEIWPIASGSQHTTGQ